MHHLVNPFNLVLCFVVISFWGTAILLARSGQRANQLINQRGTLTPLLMLPVFFILVGVCINAYLLPWGTYVVAIIHVLMMPALFKVAKSKQ